MEIIKKKEKIEQENLGVKEQTKEDNDEIENIYDPYHEL